jgi:hypothetical protein
MEPATDAPAVTDAASASECEDHTVKKSCKASAEQGCEWNKKSKECVDSAGFAVQTTDTPTDMPDVGCKQHTVNKACKQSSGCRWSKKQGVCSEPAATDAPTTGCDQYPKKRTCLADADGRCRWNGKGDVCVRRT